MSASAPSDEAWAALCTQVATLQADLARISSRVEVLENRLSTLEQEPTLDVFMQEFHAIREDIRDIVRYIARRDDISEMRVN